MITRCEDLMRVPNENPVVTWGWHIPVNPDISFLSLKSIEDTIICKSEVPVDTTILQGE